EALAGAPTERLVLLHAAAEQAARALRPADGGEEVAALGDAASAALEELGNDARAFFRDATRAPEVAARAFALLRARCRLLRAAVRTAEGEGGGDDAPFRLVELQEIENALRRETEPFAGDADAPAEVEDRTEDGPRETEALRL